MRKARIASRNRTSTSPLAYPRTVRNHDLTILTSLPAGKMVPIAAIPLLREDSARVRLQMAFQAMETAELLINEINVDVKAYLVPTLAFERFTGMDDLNRAYEGKPAREGMPVTPFIELTTAGPNVANNPILRYLGKHVKPGTQYNTAYHEAYNMIWNYRAANRSPDIQPRHRTDHVLAPAFWKHERFAHIVPDFDQAIMDGNVALNVVQARMPIRGLNFRVDHSSNEPFGGRDGNNDHAVLTRHAAFGEGIPNNLIGVDFTNNVLNVYAELQKEGITVSLANIDLARKTQAFAKARQAYTGHLQGSERDDYIVDMLMDGLTVPEQAWRQPILLQERSTIFGMAKRYATNGGDLTESVVNGAAMIDLNFAVPRCPVGGVIMVVAEVTPGQLFERGRDPYLHATKVEDFPAALRDTLDPEPVEVVPNGYIDVSHDVPNGTFGYAPMNHAWNFAAPAIGGRFFRPTVDTSFDEDRQRIWAVETKNPVLSQDFYLCTTMHTKPFVNPAQDPFEATCVGRADITGLTQFGPVLIEASNDYEEVKAEAPTKRIEKPGV